MTDRQQFPTDPAALLEMAAEAADKAIHKQTERINQLTAELAKAQEQLERLKQLAALGKPQPGRLEEPDLFASSTLSAFSKYASTSAAAAAAARAATAVARAAEDKRQTQAVADINLTLAATGAPMKVGELQAAIKKELGREWGESTLYAHLAKGRDSGLYHHVNNTWSITDKGMKEVF